MSTRISEVDFSRLLDVRVDYLFKLIFGNDKPRLISLLNAIFANKRIDRVITDLVLEKEEDCCFTGRPAKNNSNPPFFTA